MKRSEVVAIIQGFTSPETASVLLSKLEAAGMLPPERKIGVKDFEALMSFGHTSDKIKAFHQWDKENE